MITIFSPPHYFSGAPNLHWHHYIPLKFLLLQSSSDPSKILLGIGEALTHICFTFYSALASFLHCSYKSCSLVLWNLWTLMAELSMLLLNVTKQFQTYLKKLHFKKMWYVKEIQVTSNRTFSNKSIAPPGKTAVLGFYSRVEKLVDCNKYLLQFLQSFNVCGERGVNHSGSVQGFILQHYT